MENTYSWTAPEFIFKEKTSDWYWSIGIITVCSVIATIIFHNYLFAILLFFSGLTFMFLGTHRPEIVPFELTEKTLKAKNTTYNLNEIKGFTINEQEDKVLLESGKFLTAMIVIPLSEDADKETIRRILSVKLEEKELEEPPFEKIIEFLGI
jgi:hypothetical protein